VIKDSERIIDLYERHARTWVAARNRSPKFIEKGWIDRFVMRARSGGTILDLGCGSGKPIASHLATEGFKICGVDSSNTMTELARTNLPHCEWITADMRTLALHRRFDGIVAWDSFFHLSRDAQRRMFSIFRDHATPGAPLLFTSGPRDGIGRLQGEALYHASLDPAEYRELLAANGFMVLDQKMEDPDCGGHSIWLACRNESA
jgi:2-polyprenyl-3-methyl-5-hydroxy-6-metoxy-1,4-benzoquinol methylase